MYTTWSEDKEFQSALASTEKSYPKEVASATVSGYRNIGGDNTSVRDSFTALDYNYFRPEEAGPRTSRQAIAKCMRVYEEFPIVQNVVDMMGEFATKGIRVCHPRTSAQQLGRDWFERVEGPDRSERIANMLYRASNVFVQRKVAKIPDVANAAKKVHKLDTSNLDQNEIPIGYALIDPRIIDVMDVEINSYLGVTSFKYGVTIPKIWRESKQYVEMKKKLMFNHFSDYVLDGLTKDLDVFPVPQENIVALYYKKDDFEIWSTPMLYPILKYLDLYSKHMLADKAALDGAISNVRIWTLGDLEHKIIPQEPAINRLSNILLNNTGGGVIDLVWGPDIKMQQTTSEIYKFLGSAKYAPVMQAIYQGLGIPSSLTGGEGDTGYSNNVISIKILLNRLAYGRSVVNSFWKKELAIIQNRFGFREPFQLQYDIENFNDEVAQNKIIMDLLDRNVISDEFMQEKVGAIPEIERSRLKKEGKGRVKGKLPEKAGPYHTDSQHKNALEKAFVGSGRVNPRDVGMEFDLEDDNIHQPEDDTSLPNEDKKKEKPGKKPAGRPPGSKDKEKRKDKKVKVRKLTANAQKAIDEVLLKPYLKKFGASSVGDLSCADLSKYNEFALRVLVNLDDLEYVQASEIKGLIRQGSLRFDDKLKSEYHKLINDYVEANGHTPSQEVISDFHELVYLKSVDIT